MNNQEIIGIFFILNSIVSDKISKFYSNYQLLIKLSGKISHSEISGQKIDFFNH